MAQFTSYLSGGSFSPITFTDDSKRILSQADDLIKKTQVLGEYRTQQAATLANNLNIEFERSKAYRDENYRRRQKQLEFNFKAQEQEGRQQELVAQQNTQMKQAFKKSEDARKMRALQDGIKAFGEAGAGLVEDQINKATEAGEAAAQAEQLKKQAAINENGRKQLLGADPVPGSEIVGETARQGATDVIETSQANETRLDEATQQNQFNNPLQRLFGINAAYKTALTKERNKILGQNFNTVLASATRDATQVTVDINGAEQTLAFGDPSIQRNPEAYQQAMSQIAVNYAKENGIDRQDPVYAKSFYDGVNGVINENLNSSFVSLRADNKEKALGTVKAEFNSITAPTIADLDLMSTKLVSIQGVGDTKEVLFNMAASGAIPLELFNDYVETSSFFIGKGNQPTIADTDPSWVEDVRIRATGSEAQRKEFAEDQFFATKILPQIETATNFGMEDGKFNTTERTLAAKKIIDSNPGLTEAQKVKVFQSIDTLGKNQNTISAREKRTELEQLAAKNELTEEMIRDASYIIGADSANTFLETISGTSLAPLPDSFNEKKVEQEVRANLRQKLGILPNMVGAPPDASIFAATREGVSLFKRQYRNYISKDGLAPERAAEQAMLDIRQKIATDGDGDTFGVLPGANSETKQNIFPAFTPNNNPNWQPTSNVVQLNKQVEAVKGGTVPMNQTPFFSATQVDDINNQINTGKSINIPGYVYPLAQRLGTTPEKLIESQLELYGKDVRLSGPTAITRISETTVDPLLQQWLNSRPTQANVDTAVALGKNFPAKFGSGQQGYQQVKSAAIAASSEYPELSAAMWATSTNYGTTETFIYDDAGNKMGATPKEYVEWANKTFAAELKAQDLTYGEMLDTGVLPETMRPVLTGQGLLTKKPTKFALVGSTPTTDLTVAYVTGSMTFGKESTAGEHLHVNWEDNPNTPQNEADSYIDQHNRMMNDSILLETGKGTNEYLPPAEWEKHTAKLGYPTTAVQRHGADRGGRKHGGFDFRSQAGSKIKLKNGARIIKVIPGTQNGDHVFIQFKDGSIMRLLHGKFSGVKY